MVTRRPEISIKAITEFIESASRKEGGDSVFSFPSGKALFAFIDEKIAFHYEFLPASVTLTSSPPAGSAKVYDFIHRELITVVNHLLFVHRDNLLHPALLLPGEPHEIDHPLHARRYQELLTQFRRTHDPDDILVPISFFSGTHVVPSFSRHC